MTAVTLLAYLALLLAIGIWSERRVTDTSDFHLAGRRLGPVVAALSASASSSSAWTLLGVSGAAYLWGLPAIWLVPAVLSGFVINWYLVAPRLQAASHADGTLTLIEFLAKGCDTRSERRLRILGACLILFCFSLYVAAQFQGGGVAIAAALPVGGTAAMIAGALVVVGYVLLGGFWAASVTDVVQGLMMLFVSLVLPAAALLAVGGPAGLYERLIAAGAVPTQALPDPGAVLIVAVFVAGLFGIGLGYPGQPHVVNRFMAMRSGREIGRARLIALVWAAPMYLGMVVLGWCGRLLLPGLEDQERVLLDLTDLLLPAALGGMVSGSVLAAIMSTVDSQLLVAGSAMTHDLRPGRPSVALDRLVVVAVGVVALLLAQFLPQSIFARVLFAWQVLGNGFGPLLLVLLWVGPMAGSFRLGAMTAGAGLTILLSFMPDAPGDAAERLLPFAAAGVIALAGARGRRAALEGAAR